MLVGAKSLPETLLSRQPFLLGVSYALIASSGVYFSKRLRMRSEVGVMTKAACGVEDVV